MPGLGLEKVLVKKKLLMLKDLDQFFNQELLLQPLKKRKNQKSSGLLLVGKLSIQTPNLWVLLQDLSQDFSRLVTLVDICG